MPTPVCASTSATTRPRLACLAGFDPPPGKPGRGAELLRLDELGGSTGAGCVDLAPAHARRQLRQGLRGEEVGAAALAEHRPPLAGLRLHVHPAGEWGFPVRAARPCRPALKS